jgi:predicted Zn finger-like uncharacterized protein
LKDSVVSESISADSEVIGAATCDECRARIKILEKHRPLIGKAVRCPKCRALFTLSLDVPSVAEQSAIAAEEERTKEKKRNKRTRDEIRAGHIEKALSGFKSLHARLQSLAQEAGNKEEQVRIWCVDALRSALGYDDDELETERKVLNGRIDIAIKKDGKVLIVVECKAIRSRLGANVLEQAGTYAATLSASWVVLTNGDIWKLYRVIPRNGHEPKLELVFDVALLDDDGISARDAENLYLLTSRAMSCGDTEKAYHRVVCKNSIRLRSALFSERVVKAIRLELVQSYEVEAETKVQIDDEEMLEALRDEFDLTEL